MSHLENDLNQYLKIKLAEDIVIFYNFSWKDDSFSTNINNRSLIFSTKIRRERVFEVNLHSLITINSLSNVKPIFTSCYFMLVINFTDNNYSESLHFISNIIIWFGFQLILNHIN